MICKKCNNQNVDGSSFCIRCGANLKEVSLNNEYVHQGQPVTQSVGNVYSEQFGQVQPLLKSNNEQIVNNAQMTNSFNSLQNINVTFNYLIYIISIILHPFKSFNEEKEKLNNSKTAFILTLVISGLMTVLNLVTTIFNVVRVKSYYSNEVSWVWDNLQEINFIELIGKNFLIYTCIILVIAVVFYIASLVGKKQLDFIKSLSISATSVIPAVVASMLISPIVGLIWSDLSMVITVVGMVYTMILVYELMNNELQLQGDIKIYFNLVCFGILAIVGYYAYMKLFVSTGYDMSNLLDFFN